MKRKSLLAIALIAAASSNAFSMNIVKGKLLDHKQWSTANNKSIATFKEVDFDQKKLALLLSKHKNDSWSFTFAAARMNENTPTEITVGDTLDISGTTNVVIENNTSDSKTYIVEQSICYNPYLSPYTVCNGSTNTIQLDVGGYFSVSEKPDWNITFDTAGLNNVSVETGVRSEDNTMFASDDYRSILVNAVKK